jgi:hypothetical protein
VTLPTLPYLRGAMGVKARSPRGTRPPKRESRPTQEQSSSASLPSQQTQLSIAQKNSSDHPGAQPESQATLDPILRFIDTPSGESSDRPKESCHLRALWCNGLHIGYILISKVIFKVAVRICAGPYFFLAVAGAAQFWSSGVQFPSAPLQERGSALRSLRALLHLK